MRNGRAFLSVAVAAAVLLTGAVAMADGRKGGGPTTNQPTQAPSPPPLSCSTGLFDARVSSGPTFVPCDAPGGLCTAIEYEVTSIAPPRKRPTHVLALEGVGVWNVEPMGSQWYAPCEGTPGDDDAGFGRNACHQQAIKVNSKSGVARFKVILAGLRLPGPTSIAAPSCDDDPRHGHDVSACTILGLGLEGGSNPYQATQGTERVNFKGCVVEFTRDSLTGDVVKAQLLTPTSIETGEACQSPTLNDDGFIDPRHVGEIQVTVGEVNLGTGKFGDGYIATGRESCTTRVIGGRVYTWGTQPCP